MKRKIPYLNEEVASRDFKYYIFDWDDNILHMPTKIRMEHLEDDGTWRPVEVSTSTFALVRADETHYRPPSNGGWAAAFANFEDRPDETDDDRNNRWIDGVGDGEFGTDAEEFDYYLGMCRYSAVTYGGFKERMANDPIYKEKLAVATTAARPELAKEFAIRDFVEHVFHMLRRAGQLNLPGF